MPLRYLESFRKGDPVPSWIFDCEPAEPGAIRPTVRFGCDCHVVDVTGGYFIVPDTEIRGGCAYFANDGHGKTVLSAASRTVITPMQFMVTGGPDDDRGDGEGTPVNPMKLIGA